MSTPSGELALHLQRLVPAPPPVVFRMHAEPELFANWFGPKGFAVQRPEFDVRVGGSYRFWMQPPEGEPFTISGEFQEIDPPVLLVYTFRYDPPAPDGSRNGRQLCPSCHGTSTEVSVDQAPFATAERLALHQQGWSDTLERLEAVLAT